MATMKEHTKERIAELLTEKREELRKLRFAVAGSAERNVKKQQMLRKEIARMLTELSGRTA